MKNKIKVLLSLMLCLAFTMSAVSCSIVLELPNTPSETLSSTITSDSDTAEAGKITETKTEEKTTQGTPLSTKELGDIIDITQGTGGKRAGIADIVEMIEDSAVAISVYGTARDYFNREYPTEGAGSGVIISSDGYILTNNHVITGGDTITVFLQDGREYTARIIGADESSDLAVLKIEAEGLTNAKIGDSSTLRVGDYAIAVGNPLGELQGTVSMGIISALDRSVTVDGNDLVLLQTDAAVNPGNSGGGIFDSNGDLIGIVTAKEAAENVEGIGFAIPIDIAKPIVADLISYGYVTGRPGLGIETIYISSRYSAMINRVEYLGVYVYNVHSGTPAEASGLKRADYIRSVDGEVIETEDRFWDIIESKKVGDIIKVEIYRNGETLTLDVTIEEAR